MDPEGKEPTKMVVSVEEFEKVKSQMQTWQAKATDYEKRFDGIDPETFKAMKGDYELLRKEKAAGNKDEIEKLLKDRETELEKRYAKKFEEYDSLTKTQSEELKKLRVTSVVMKDATEYFHAGTLELLEPIINRDCDWVDGKIVVKGEDGKPRASLADPRNQMDYKEYLGTLVSKYESAAKPTAIQGGKQGGNKSVPSLTGIRSLNDLGKYADKGKAALAAMPDTEVKQLLNTPIRIG